MFHLFMPRRASVARRVPTLGLLPGMLTTSEFEAVFQREAARAERFAREFCVVRIAAGGLTGRQLRRLAKLLRSSTRLSDGLGLLSSNEVGILLADTDVDGAEGFCLKLQGVLADHGLVVDQCIYQHEPAAVDAARLAASLQASPGQAIPGPSVASGPVRGVLAQA